MPDFSKQLSKYIPAEAAPIISQWINDTQCRFKINRSRRTKLGDYRAPFRGQTHQITVNHDLNPYAFLVTTVHEFAHLQTWKEHQHQVKPHGVEWKKNFNVLMQPFMKLKILPSDIENALLKYLKNPSASSCTDISLYRVLKRYDEKKSDLVYVEGIPFDGVFSMPNGRVFRKKEKLRKRYRCEEISSGKYYLFHPIAEVLHIESEKDFSKLPEFGDLSIKTPLK